MDAVIQVPLSNGGVSLVDAADFYGFLTCELRSGYLWTGRICDLTWHWRLGNKRSSHRYACASIHRRKESGNTGMCLRMHRAIMGAKAGQIVDHRRSEATLDNRRENLRFATQSQNSANSTISVSKTSVYRGVLWDRGAGKWRGSIKAHGKTRYLGLFLDPEEAARAYDAAALQHFGEFARLNFPQAKAS